MEVKSKIKKLGLLSQAVLASTVCLMSTSVGAAEQIVAGVAAPVGAGDWAKFTAAGPGTVAAGVALGTSTVPLATVAGVSAYTTVDNQGVLRFDGAGITVPSDLGESKANLESVTLNTAGAVIGATTSGQIFAKGILFNNAGNVGTLTVKNNTIVGVNDVVFTGAVDHILNVDSTNTSLTVTSPNFESTVANRSIINFLGGKTITANGVIGPVNGFLEVNVTGDNTVVNVSNDIRATDIQVKNKSALNVNDTGKTFDGDFEVVGGGGTLNINSNLLTVTGTTIFGANDRISVQTSDAVFAAGDGLVASGGNAIFDIGALITVTPVGYITNANPIKIISSPGGGGVAAIPAAQITGQSAVLSFTANAAGAADDLVLDVTRRAYDSGVHNLNGQAAGLGAALEADGAAGRLAAGNADFEAFVGNVDRLATSAEVATALSTAAPTVNSAIVSTAHEIGERVLTNIDNRITLVRSGERSYNTGMSAGDTTEGWGVWGELFGSDFTQDKRNNIEGYDGNLWGVTLGVDWMVDNATLLGLAATYSTTDVDHDLANNTLDIDSFQGSLYGSFTCNPWYVQGMLGVAHHDYDQTRNIIVRDITSGRALGDYKAWEWLANAEAGYIWTDGAWNVIPSASLRYSHLSIDDYTETGAGGFNLKVRNEDVNAFVAGLGLKVQYNNVYGGSRIVPEAHVGAFYDFIADRQETSSNIFGTGTAFNSKGFDPAHDSYEVGVGLNIYTERNSIFSINYDYRFKSDFHSHNGFVKLRYQW
ncbi:MAG: autotransporter domain-containing protein [Gammaproteobacteria bacterium]